MKQQPAEYKKTFEIIVEDDWILIKAQPNSFITNNVILSMLKDLYSLEAYRSEKTAGLWDFRECDSDLNYQKMNKITKYINANYDPKWSHTVTAIVANEELTYGLARMYEIMTDHIPTKISIFKDMEKAQQWLREKIK